MFFRPEIYGEGSSRICKDLCLLLWKVGFCLCPAQGPELRREYNFQAFWPSAREKMNVSVCTQCRSLTWGWWVKVLRNKVCPSLPLAGGSTGDEWSPVTAIPINLPGLSLSSSSSRFPISSYLTLVSLLTPCVTFFFQIWSSISFVQSLLLRPTAGASQWSARQPSEGRVGRFLSFRCGKWLRNIKMKIIFAKLEAWLHCSFIRTFLGNGVLRAAWHGLSLSQSDEAFRPEVLCCRSHTGSNSQFKTGKFCPSSAFSSSCLFPGRCMLFFFAFFFSYCACSRGGIYF